MDKNKASVWKRIFAYLIDSLIITIPLFVFMMIGIFFRSHYWYGIDWDLIIVSIFITQIFSYVYILFKDALFDGRSIGKKVLNLQVVNNRKKPCSIVKSLLRNITLIIPFLPIIELIMIIVDKNGKRLGDRLAKTQVIPNPLKSGTEKRRDYSLLFLSIIFSLLILLYIILGVVGSISYESKYDNYVYLSPVDQLSDQQLSESKSMIETRLNIYRYPILESFIENNQIVLRIPDELKENRKLLEEIVQPLVFEAKVGNTVVFRGGNDIEYVCRSTECSGIDPNTGCGQSNGQWNCRFRFSISLSPEAAKTQAERTRYLDVVVEEGNQEYLNETLELYLDNQNVDSLSIGSELKGRSVTDIQISGSGSGTTRQEALSESLKNMKRLQTILISGSIPCNFTISKIE